LGKRRRSREFALRVLYQLEISKEEIPRIIVQQREHLPPGDESDEFAERIVKGVQRNGSEIDQMINRYSENWRLDRMNLIDRNILRMAVFELLYCEDIPPKVTLNEAVELGKKYGSEESGSFINGILDRIRNEVARKPLQPKPALNCKGDGDG
jgi:N utilization substance protein B